MKNLKKLTVVLFATLLSFNFTSCIDDGVSDAVDQVYLAQAQFLLAQAALQNAEAQYQLARAASEQANAAYTDAQTAYQQAVTANFIATTTEANAFTAASNAIALAQLQAQSAVDLQNLATALAQAQSAYDVAMINLATAVQDAKDAILSSLYGDLQTANYNMDVLMAQKLSLEADKALKELLLAAPGNTVTWAFAQAALEGQLAQYVADKAAAEANLAAVQAATPSNAQQQATDLQADMDAIQAQAADKEVELAEANNAVAAALAQWNADNAEFGAIFTKQADIANLEAEIQAHLDDIATWQQAILDAQNDINVNIPNADAAITAAQADVTTAQADVTTAQAAVNTAQAALGTETLPAPIAGDAALTGTTLYDVLWNAQLDLANIQFDIAALTLTYNTAVTNLANHIATGAGLVAAQATAQTAQIAAQADYDVAVAAFNADPTGLTVTNPGPDGVAGDPNNGATDYIYVVTAVVGGPNATGMSTVTPPTSPLTGAAVTYIQVTNTDGNDVGVPGDYYDVEFDDITDSNANILNQATNALNNANAALAAADLAITNYATTLADLQADYLYQQTIFDNAVAEEAAVQATVDAAQAAVNAGTTTLTNANNVLAAANTAFANATTALTNANNVRSALGTVASLQTAIAGWQQNIADTQALMPSHQAGLAYLQAELADLMVTFNLDPTLLDTEYYFGYVPSYIAWIEATQARDAIQAEINALQTQYNAIDNIRNAVLAYLSNNEDVSDFQAWQSAAITALETTIDNLTTSIENQEVLIAKGELDADAMAAAIAECQRKIDVVDANIAIQDSIITSLLARINTYIN